MILRSHHVPMGEETLREFSMPLCSDAKILYFHTPVLDEHRVELVEIHDEQVGVKVTRRFLVVDTFCTERASIPATNLRFIQALPFKNHLWNFFEIVESAPATAEAALNSN